MSSLLITDQANNVTRSESSKEKSKRLACLNIKSLQSSLSPKEEEKLNKLREVLPTTINLFEDIPEALEW